MEVRSINYETKIVAFVDILGFKQIIRESESNYSKLNVIYEALNFLKNAKQANNWGLKYIEIEEDAQKKGVENFDIAGITHCSCFSDTIVVSVTANEGRINEIVSTLIANLAYIGAKFISEGILLRGAITIGNLVHNEDEVVMGQALIEAYELENGVAKYPRIIISNKLLSKLNYPLLAKNMRYPYHQYLTRYNDGCVGFHQIKYYEVLQSWIGMSKEQLKLDLGIIRQNIINGLDADFEHPDIFLKYQWLKDAFNDLIILENGTKQPIKAINETRTSHNIQHGGSY